MGPLALWVPGDRQAAHTRLATPSQGFEVLHGPQGLGLSTVKAAITDLLRFDGTKAERTMWFFRHIINLAERLLPHSLVAETIQTVVFSQNVEG